MRMKELNSWYSPFLTSKHVWLSTPFSGVTQRITSLQLVRSYMFLVLSLTVLLGCYISIGKLDEAQSLLDDIPNLAGRKVAGNRPPTEVFIERKSTFLAHYVSE